MPLASITEKEMPISLPLSYRFWGRESDRNTSENLRKLLGHPVRAGQARRSFPAR